MKPSNLYWILTLLIFWIAPSAHAGRALSSQSFDFGGPFQAGCDPNGPGSPLSSLLTTFRAIALPDVSQVCGKYVAKLVNNAGNITLHYNQREGRSDSAAAVRFPFAAVVRGAMVTQAGTLDQLHTVNPGAYVFTGIKIHHVDPNNLNSAHVVSGQRGNKPATLEGKHTRNGVSTVDDSGAWTTPSGNVDILILGLRDRTLKVYYQEHAPSLPDQWMPYRGTGDLPGPAPDWGTGNQVRVEIITYASGQNGVPFWGVIESFSVMELR